MDTTILRNEIHRYIDNADERFLNLVYGMIQADQTEDEYELSESEIRMLEERLADYKKNPDSGSSWEDVKKRLLK
jgi:putative addiction module component (TIGR02574 family)